jgi:hypothetical protein
MGGAVESAMGVAARSMDASDCVASGVGTSSPVMSIVIRLVFVILAGKFWREIWKFEILAESRGVV